MNKSKRTMSVLILFALAIVGVSAQAQPRRNADRQISSILQRLEQNSNRFHNSFNLALASDRIDETRSQNDINSFEPSFAGSLDQFRAQFNRRNATAADVQDVLQKASVINGFMTRNRLNPQVQNDWTSVRTDLNALASAYGLSWQWSQTPPPQMSSTRSLRLSESELNQLIRRVTAGGDTFRSSLNAAFGRNTYGQPQSTRDMLVAVGYFRDATNRLRNRFDAKQPLPDHVAALLGRATPIDVYMSNNQTTAQAQDDWSTLRGELNILAGAYNLSTSWQTGGDQRNTQTGYDFNSRLTGTFRLDPTRSDNARDVADRVTRSLSTNERQSVHDRMLARLESPELLSIERRGTMMTVASSRAPQSTFEANGIERQEQLNGRSSRVTAGLNGDQLIVKSTGYRENDFNVTFESIENGQRLRIRREIFSDRLNQPVVVNSVYDRTSTAPQWNIYDGTTTAKTGVNSGEFIMNDGETVVAVLNNDLTTKQAKQGDRFTMTIRDNGQYEGAIISGTVGTVSQGGTLTGRSGMTLDFDTIRLRSGQTYRFAGILTGVRSLNGDTVKVDNEGGAQGDNQTTQTATRAGIGTAIGAIIGAIAGGGKGAAIGGVIGAVGGAGSVYVTGKDSLELPTGTELTVRSSAPGR